ncbi:cytochrome C [Sphingomonas oleivorans]|nr:cytochrome C [Sphingomonas oleivorans]
MPPFVAIVAAMAVASSFILAIQARAAVTPLSEAQSDYVEYCAGCHGMQGSSAPSRVPELRDRVGHFLCTREGRAYLIRLPNVAHAPIRDDAQLARLMNFVVFALGGKSAPSDALPYSGSEVAAMRKNALKQTALVNLRRRIVADLVRRCGAPPDLHGFSAGAPFTGEAGATRSVQSKR